MILYKYVDLDTAHLMIENATLKFSRAYSFNDPFELMSLHYGEDPNSAEQMMKRISVSDSYGILSLTRNPLNPLMWAHYGKGKYADFTGAIRLDQGNDSHAGIVFGIDVNEAGLNSTSLNVIPAKYGSVIYTATKPKHPFEHSESLRIYEGLLSSFEPETLEALQRIFLYKSFHWSYEEEVRVVRNIFRGHFDNEIHSIAKTSFKEAYLGIRNASNRRYLNDLKDRFKNILPDCDLYVCAFNNSDWKLVKISIDDAISQLKGFP